MPRKGEHLTPEHLRALALGRDKARRRDDGTDVAKLKRRPTASAETPPAFAELLAELRAIRSLLDSRLPGWSVTVPIPSLTVSSAARIKEKVRQFSEPEPIAVVEPTALPEAVEETDLADELAQLNAELADELPPPTPVDENWRKRLTLFARYGQWLPEWQGRPGQADCVAPPDLLEEYGFIAR